ncbi:Uncharacterised protein [Candidatus Bilamarchaeum dharawalense]|uniref:Uncharacterized protein n=1 Tax=Candidatus Bilamarchaeum dharawalense TaxID=2885759 RepID=A0A5E4LUM7_9ARCH|nr:Uncharacterised protein [Candidatus Bilamarchaeum dharawalense]
MEEKKARYKNCEICKELPDDAVREFDNSTAPSEPNLNFDKMWKAISHMENLGEYGDCPPSIEIYKCSKCGTHYAYTYYVHGYMSGSEPTTEKIHRLTTEEFKKVKK